MLDFIKYHRHVGVERFIFFDREYHPLSKLLAGEPDVEIIHFPDVPANVHAEAWKNLIAYNKGKTKWLALIDADQALVPVHTNDVRYLLSHYEAYASLQCNWKTFGSGGHLTKTPGSVYERFTKCAPTQSKYNAPTQFICQPDRTLALRTHDPHHPRLPDNEMSVNTARVKVVGPFNHHVLHDIMYVAHYSNKSREEWAIKNAKGRADIFGEKMSFTQFDEYEAECNLDSDDRVLNLWLEANK